MLICISENHILFLESKLVTKCLKVSDFKHLFFSWRIVTSGCTRFQHGGYRAKRTHEIQVMGEVRGS